MKVKFIVFFILLIFVKYSFAEDSLEYKVASIDAGRWIEKNDTSVTHISILLDETSKIFDLSKMNLADMAAKGKRIAREKGVDVSISQILEASLIICEKKCSPNRFNEIISSYIVTRSITKQTHYQAIHGIVILNNLEKK